MANINIGTSTTSTATGISPQRKIIKTSADRIALFSVIDGNSIKYQISDDNGATWNGSWLTAYSDTVVWSFDIWFDSATNDIYLVIDKTTTATRGWSFLKLTYSAGSWTPASAVSINTGVSRANPKITKRSNGDFWVAGLTSSDVYFRYSTDNGANWNNGGNTALGDVNAFDILPQDTYIWAIYQRLSKLVVYQYDSSWDGGANIVTSGITNSVIGLGTTKISDYEIYVAARTSSGIKIFEYTGSWDSGTLLSNNSNDQSPYISQVGGNPVVFWRDYDGTNYQISYRNYKSGSWQTQVDLTADSSNNHYPAGIYSSVGYNYIIWTVGSASPYSVYFAAVEIDAATQKTILSNANVFAEDITETILSDAEVTDSILKIILSDAQILAPTIYDINNKINFVTRILSDINNKINIVFSNLSNINNYINFVNAYLLDINNDFRTQKRTLNNINNDFRFMYSWQKGANNSLQSLGKSYIKVYINSIEQTDVDIDSINISKDLNVAHTASFDLARAYDSSKPTMESIVQIKYNNWILFSGYITKISPADDPEKMRIDCQDEYWKQNKTNKYYQVGHKPQDNQELYYDTLNIALSTEHSWNLNIGNFVPQTVNNFAVGTSDAITNLIQEAGNYGWFYDIDGTKKLWTAGHGSIINIQRQSIGTNIKLYDLIQHVFSEEVNDIINKYRVQMGDKVIRKFNETGGSRTYTGYNYSSYHQFVSPAWDKNYEVLAKFSGVGYGWDYHKPEDAELYKDVFKKYNMPYLNPQLSSWSDRYPPRVEIYSTNWLIFNAPIATLTEGFTIDYENQTITFNEPIYLYQTDARGEISAIRAPSIRVFLWKKDYYTYTTDPNDDPETDVTNPLMFFTDKMGDYPDTIIKDLNLSNLSIQEGDTQILADGSTEFIPSWDDTEFAKDLANWQLSKICDKKIKGTITLTLDAVCFYNIDLTKRIYIANITESPMNITSINYDINNFTVSLTLENSRSYNRTISFPSHGE